MTVCEIVQREVGAIKRDIEWERGWKDQIGRPFDECMEHMNQYPSLLTRFAQLRGRVYRAKSNVVEFPHTVKNFIHRGRYGWAESDTWSMDYTLAKQLEGVFREFVRTSSSMIDYEQDDTDKIALEIADGFKAYCDYQDNEGEFSTMDGYSQEAYDEAMAKVGRSFDLMKENWPRFWW